MCKSAAWLALTFMVSSTNAMSAGWPERWLAHDTSNESSRAIEKVVCDFSTVDIGKLSATFTRGWCGIDAGMLSFTPGESDQGASVSERQIKLSTLLSASHQASKLTEQLQLKTRDQIIVLNVLTDDGGRKSREHAIDFWSALRKEGVAPINGTRVITEYPNGATTW